MIVLKLIIERSFDRKLSDLKYVSFAIQHAELVVGVALLAVVVMVVAVLVVVVLLVVAMMVVVVLGMVIVVMFTFTLPRTSTSTWLQTAL